MKKNKIVLFTGGTGGHVKPAECFGNYLIQNGYECTIFIDKRGSKYLKKFKGKIIYIQGRHFSGGLFYKIYSFLILFFGFIKSFLLLFNIRPSSCIAFGSYASFMPLLATLIVKIFSSCNIYLHEQNSIIGKVNLFFLPYAKNIFLNIIYNKQIKNNYSKKIIYTGLPTEKTLLFDRDLDIKDNKIKIFVYGGSQGSYNLNKGFIEIFDRLPLPICKKLSITIQSSKKFSTINISKLKKLNIDFYSKPFFEDIDNILKSSDIVVSRSGAGTINDIIQYQIPSILVPLPHSKNNHQLFNAKFLSNKKAALLINESELNTDLSLKIFEKIISNNITRINIIKNLKNINLPNANLLMKNEIIK